MEAQPRGRSPSAGHRQQHISPIPSPSNYHDASSGLDPSVNEQTFTTGKFNTSNQFTPFLEAGASHTQRQNILQENPFYPNSQFNQSTYSDGQFPGQNLDPSFGAQPFMYHGESMPHEFNSGFAMNNPYGGVQQANVNPADLSKMSPPQDHTSPSLLSPEHQSSPGQPGSPASTNGQFYTPQHSRHQSLDPAAAYGQGDWQGMTFQQHRRAPSDQSDVSSNAASPFVPSQRDILQSMQGDHSPYLAAQTDTGNSFGIETFSLNEPPRTSPGHSPYISPRLLPTQSQGLGLSRDHALDQSQMGPAMYPPHPESSYPGHMRNTSTVSDMGQAAQFTTPTINIEPAPVSRQGSFGPDHQDMGNSLSPPGKARGRSKSDATNNRGTLRSASPLGRHSDTLSVRSHSPAAQSSRGSSPGPDSGRIEKNRRASTSSVNSRDYILDLADPNRPSASPSGGSQSRVQKHPATFQCKLCPKRFTRAYNLRSHLRTHTDERPFSCTVCGKAFARQHDRKRHEGLHSGEKKFVCRGELRSLPGQSWGCGRRFARADALGRHFRSEAGRVCIKPLLDEEAAERRTRQLAEQAEQLQYASGGQMRAGMPQVEGGLQPVPPSMVIPSDPGTGMGGFMLPAALLAQYPALQNLDWNALANSQQGMMDDDDGELSDIGQRNSFDASSGGEYYDDGADGDYGNVGAVPGMGYGGSGQPGY